MSNVNPWIARAEAAEEALEELRNAVMMEWGFSSQSLQCRRVLGEDLYNQLYDHLFEVGEVNA